MGRTYYAGPSQPSLHLQRHCGGPHVFLEEKDYTFRPRSRWRASRQ
jgi:hypothetical protein